MTQGVKEQGDCNYWKSCEEHTVAFIGGGHAWRLDLREV